MKPIQRAQFQLTALALAFAAALAPAAPQEQPASAPQPPAATPPASPAGPAAAGAAPGAQMPDFETDFNVALARAKAEGKILLAEFYRDNCPYCERMQTTVYPTPEVAAFSKEVVWLRIDQEQPDGAALRRRFQGGSTPMYMAISHDGKGVFYRFSGASSRKGFLHNLSLISVTRDDCAKARQGSSTIGQRFTLAKGELMEGRIEAGATMLQQLIDADAANESGLVDDALVLLGMLRNAGSREGGPFEAYLEWAKVVRQYPESDRGADAVLYIGKMFRETGRADKVKQINPLLKSYPEGVDVAGCVKVLDEK